MPLLEWGAWEGNPLDGGGETIIELEVNVEEAALRKGMKTLAYRVEGFRAM